MKDELGVSIRKYRNLDERIKDRLESLSDLYPLISSLPYNDFHENVLNTCKEVIGLLNAKVERDILDRTLGNAENIIINYIFTKLGIVWLENTLLSRSILYRDLLASVFEKYIQENLN